MNYVRWRRLQMQVRLIFFDLIGLVYLFVNWRDLWNVINNWFVVVSFDDESLEIDLWLISHSFTSIWFLWRSIFEIVLLYFVENSRPFTFLSDVVSFNWLIVFREIMNEKKKTICMIRTDEHRRKQWNMFVFFFSLDELMRAIQNDIEQADHFLDLETSRQYSRHSFFQH